MRFIYFVSVAAMGLSACGGTQLTFDELQTEALALWDAQSVEDRTMWAAVSKLSGTATYTGVGYFETTGSSVPEDALVRGRMSVEVAFGSDTPQLDGAITDFVSQADQALDGELTFVVNAVDAVFHPDDILRYESLLTGTLQAPGTNQTHDVDAFIFSHFVGADGQYLTGGIRDSQGVLMINGGFVVEN